MTKYVIIYHGPPMPADGPKMSAEVVATVMGAWMAWGEKVGKRMVEFGTPLAGGVRITKDGTSPSDREVAGYTLIEADSMAEAVALAQEHPHLNMPGGCEIEVHEAQPVPGS